MIRYKPIRPHSWKMWLVPAQVSLVRNTGNLYFHVSLNKEFSSLAQHNKISIHVYIRSCYCHVCLKLYYFMSHNTLFLLAELLATSHIIQSFTFSFTNEITTQHKKDDIIFTLLLIFRLFFFLNNRRQIFYFICYFGMFQIYFTLICKIKIIICIKSE